LNISEDEWVLLVKTLGNVKGIHGLEFNCVSGSHNFSPFQAVADAVNNAQSLCHLLIFLEFVSFPLDASGQDALANALREHATLMAFSWVAPSSRVDPDLVLRILPECPHLRTVTIMTSYASADTMRNLLQLAPATELRLALTVNQWLAVADEIRRGRCNIRMLNLTMLECSISEATEAVQKIANAIRFDSNLERLILKMESGFTDEAGVALAEALTVNTTLRQVDLFDNVMLHSRQSDKATLGARSYEACSAMLRVRTSLVLKVPPFEAAGADATLRNHVDQMIIEHRLNKVGRGRLLASRQTTKEEWVDALLKLNFTQFSDSPPHGVCNLNDSPAFRISCMYSLLRLNPSVVCSMP
jgi:hypothetical protein